MDGMRFGRWLVAAVVVFTLLWSYSRRDIEHAAGILAAAAPEQRPIGAATAIPRGEFLLRPRAEFSATVRILRREDYSFDRIAPLAPTDFAVGWGPMSDSAVLAAIEITQSNRFYYWRTQTWPVPRAAIETHSANWHVIPETDAVQRVLKDLRPGSLVELAGRLVDIEAPDGGMPTSLRRDDTGRGACEILLASRARVIEPR
jgi:hypothetical protein